MFGKNKENDRFKVVYEQGGIATCTKVIVDTQTGVNYLMNIEGYAGGMTPLLDRDGKPVISPVEP